MTNPPQDDDRQGPADDQPVPPTQEFARPPQPEPGSQYGRSATFYGPPSGGGQPFYGQPAQGQPPYGSQPYGSPPYGPPQYGPPQPGYQPYGQPPFGPPYAPPPARRRRFGLIGVLAGAVILLAGAGLALAFALRPTELDAHAVERDVAAQFQEREGIAIDLQCSDDMIVEKGKSYTCSGMTHDDEPVTLTITITDEKTAAYTWTEA